MNTLPNSIAPAGRCAADARLELIARLSETVAGPAPLYTQMAEAARLTRTEFDADACLLRRLEGRDLVMLGGSGMPEKHCRRRIAAGWGIGGEIVSKRRPLFISDATKNPLTAPLVNALPHSYPFGGYAGAPLIVDGEPVAILGLYYAEQAGADRAVDLGFLMTIANIVAAIVARSRLDGRDQSQGRGAGRPPEGAPDFGSRAASRTEAGEHRPAGQVAHNFNNMLTVMQGFSELARADIDADHPAQRHLESIAAACVRTELLTRQMLAFARREVIAPSTVRMQPLVRDAAQMLVPLLGPGIALDIEITTRTDTVFVDPGQMEHVLVNLMVNARDAMSGMGTLTLRLDHRTLSDRDCAAYDGLSPGEHVCLEIADTGCGMTDEVRRRIFEPFFTTKVQGKGTGIGLATCYTAVKQNRETSRWRARRGRGPRFGYCCRWRCPQRRRANRAGRNPRLSAEERILLVDAERAVRRVAAESLRRYGYTVCVAATGREAFETAVVHSGCFSLVVTDTVLPDTTGPDLAARIRALYPKIRVLFMSGGFETGASDAPAAQERESLLRKPFTPERLARRVRGVLGSRQ